MSQPSSSAKTSTQNNDDKLLIGKVPDPILKAVAYSIKKSDVPKDYKLVTRGDLAEVNTLFCDFGETSKDWRFDSNYEYNLSIIKEIPNLEVLDITGIRLKDYI